MFLFIHSECCLRFIEVCVSWEMGNCLYCFLCGFGKYTNIEICFPHFYVGIIYKKNNSVPLDFEAIVPTKMFPHLSYICVFKGKAHT